MIGEPDEPSFRAVRGSSLSQSHEAGSGTLSHRSSGCRESSTLVRDRLHTTELRLLGRSSGSRVVNRRHGTNSHPARPTGRLGVLLCWDEWSQRLRQRFSTRTYIAISVALVLVVSPVVFVASIFGGDSSIGGGLRTWSSRRFTRGTRAAPRGGVRATGPLLRTPRCAFRRTCVLSPPFC